MGLKRHLMLLLLVSSFATKAYAIDTGKITIISDFYAPCGLAVGLYDQDDRLLAIEKYLTTRDYKRVLFNYQPQRYNIPIESYITVRTQFPAMHRSGCEQAYQVNSYRIPWLSNNDLCLMVDVTGVAPCDPMLIYNAPAKFIGIYPPRQRNIWTPSQKEYYRVPR